MLQNMCETSGMPTLAATGKATEFSKDGRQMCGPLQLDSGAVYEGEWLNGIRDGHGK